ncbi:MAG: 3-oxoacyl-ACP reductase FabG [Marinibacterium sp.]|nr:3-oxoacyl-ACP reductase FabG [Marinibacterium sp.]
MDLGLSGRVALITGAGRGIGRAEATALAAEGAFIAINDIDPDSAERCAQDLAQTGAQAMAVAGDVTDPGCVDRIIARCHDRFGRLDVLVNNAGLGGRFLGRKVTEMAFDDWDRVIRSHMYGTFLCTRAAAPLMQDQGFGRIINTSSIHYTGGGRTGISNYSAAKAGIAGFTRTVAKELGPQGITVNAIAPGFVATDLIAGFSDDAMQRIRDQNPKRRCCTPDELGALVAFLASAQADFINGAVVSIDGGRREFVWD